MLTILSNIDLFYCVCCKRTQGIHLASQEFIACGYLKQKAVGNIKNYSVPSLVWTNLNYSKVD